MPAPAPLRTVRDSFPSYGSSLPKATNDRRLPASARSARSLCDSNRQPPARRRKVHHLSCEGVICFPSCGGSPGGFTAGHQMDVSSLSGRVTLKPVSALLQNGIRFFHPLSSTSPTACLAVAPARIAPGEDTGFPRSAYLTTNTLGPPCPPAGLLSVSSPVREAQTTRVPFGPSQQPFWLVSL